MAENPVTPTSEKTTEPKASAVPASVTPAAVAAKPVESVTPADKPVEPTKAETPAPASETPPAEAPKSPEETPPAPVVPETYEIKLEGDTKVDPNAIAAITPALKEAGMTQEGASRLVNDFLKFQSGLPAAKNAADLETIRQDDELGKLNFGRTQNEVNQALSAFTTPEERSMLSKMGMANDPTLVRMFRRIGRAMSDAGQTDAGAPPAPTKTAAQKLYGGSPASKADAG